MKIEVKKNLEHKFFKFYIFNLKILNFITVTLKGRVALEMGTCEIFLTELVLHNVISNWRPEEIAAMLSSLVFQDRLNEDEKEEEVPRLNEVCVQV